MKDLCFPDPGRAAFAALCIRRADGLTQRFAPRPFDPSCQDPGGRAAMLDPSRTAGFRILSSGGAVPWDGVPAGDDGISVGTAPPPVPGVPQVEWGLVRALVPGWNRASYLMPETTLTVDVDKDEAQALQAWLAAGSDRLPSPGTPPADTKWGRALAAAAQGVVEAYQADCARAGVFAMPFLAAAVRRGADGTPMLASQPVLLRPSDSAPLLHVTALDLGTSCLRVQLQLVSAPCRPVLRLAGGCDLTESLDIYVTPAPSMTGGGETPGIMSRTQASVLTCSGLSCDPGSLNRPAPLIAEGGTVPVLSYGRAADADVRRAWSSAPGFVRVATLQSGTAAGGWIAVQAELPGAGSLYTPDYSLHTRVSGGTAVDANGRPAVVEPVLQLPVPAAPALWCQHDDRHASAPGPAPAVSVFVLKDGKRLRTDLNPAQTEGSTPLRMNLSAAALAEGGWFFYPDPDAVAVRIRAAETERVFPLRRHASLHGAVWDAAWEAESLPLLPDLSAWNGAPDCRTAEGVMASGRPDGVPLFSDSAALRLGAGMRLRAVAPALRSLSSGELGRFPLYAFTDRGIWAVAPTDSGGWRQVQAVSLASCGSQALVAPLCDGVAFMDGAWLSVVEGSRVRRLWRLDRVVADAGAAALAYSMEEDRLWLRLSDGRVLAVSPSDGLVWGVSLPEGTEQRRLALHAVPTGDGEVSPGSLKLVKVYVDADPAAWDRPQLELSFRCSSGRPLGCLRSPGCCCGPAALPPGARAGAVFTAGGSSCGSR